MKLSAPVLFATTLAAVPASTAAWSCGPGGYGVFVNPRTSLETITPSEIRRRQREMFNRQQELFDRSAFGSSRRSVRYQIFDNDNEIKISLDLPGVKAEDIDVGIEEDGKILSISGEREKMGESGSYRVSFSQSFALDEKVDIENFSANLKNGVLVVTAPKDLQRIEDNIRKITVVDADGDVSDSEIQMKQDTPSTPPSSSQDDDASGGSDPGDAAPEDQSGDTSSEQPQ